MASTDLQMSDARYARRQRLSRWDVKFSPYIYVAPFFIVFGLVGLFPILYTAVISLMDWNMVRGEGTFVGFDNFAFVLQDKAFWVSIRNTFSIFVLSTIPQLIIATYIAAMLDHHLKARTFWRMAVLLPYVVMPVAVAIVFSQLFADQYGLINQWLGTLFGMDNVRWHVDVIPSHIAISTMVNFRWTGYNALILLAAMQAVPRELYEASAIDGAGKLRRFFSITLPQIRPTAIFVVITSTVGGLQIFDEPRLYDSTGQGGANNQWRTVALHMYDTGWGNFDFGRASAVAWLLFLIIVVFGLLNFWLTRRLVASESSGGK